MIKNDKTKEIIKEAGKITLYEMTYEMTDEDVKKKACKKVTYEDVEKAYKKLALKYYPDKNKDSTAKTTKDFRELGSAYEMFNKYFEEKIRLGINV